MVAYFRVWGYRLSVWKWLAGTATKVSPGMDGALCCSIRRRLQRGGFRVQGLGLLVVIHGVISPLTWVISTVTLLITHIRLNL